MEAPKKVTVTGSDVTGVYVVAEHRGDGTLVLRPETSEEVIDEFADRPLSEDEFLEALGRMHAATVEIGGRRFDVLSDKAGGVRLEPAVTKTVEEIHAERDGRALTNGEFEARFGGLPSDGEG